MWFRDGRDFFVITIIIIIIIYNLCSPICYVRWGSQYCHQWHLCLVYALAFGLRRRIRLDRVGEAEYRAVSDMVVV